MAKAETAHARFIIRVMRDQESCFFCDCPTTDRLARVVPGSAYASSDLIFVCHACQPGIMGAIQTAARARRGEAPAEDEEQPRAHAHSARVSLVMGVGQVIEKCACGASRYVTEKMYRDRNNVWRTRYDRGEWVEGDKRVVPRVR